jgi:threonine synthase
MKLYSTNNRQHVVSLKTAVMEGLPPDNGLYMPENIPLLPFSFFQSLPDLSFPELSFQVAYALIGEYLPKEDLKNMIDQAITFPAPVIRLNDQTYIQELFHGPSLAFKDFGARFMAQLMSYFNRGESKELTILVATSGDTGGAVAAGFHNTPGVNVVILYPAGKVSPLQEKQLTSWGDNIYALKVNGTFDDCQQLVKDAFLDTQLKEQVRITSANSINIARLIPQSFYYFEGFRQIEGALSEDCVIHFVVPSGNFGNLTAGLFAKTMGLPIGKFIAATNQNDVVPEYLETGVFTPRPSVRTLSNAMDVGNPSNFKRLLDLHGSTWNIIKENVVGFSVSDEWTLETILSYYKEFQYLLDPHGAVGLKAWDQNRGQFKDGKKHIGVVLETAHPVKFSEVIQKMLSDAIPFPDPIKGIMEKPTVQTTSLDVSYVEFKKYLLDALA